MTEKTLERAIYLDKRIKKWRNEKEILEEIRNICTENAHEENSRCFLIEVIKDGYKNRVDISSSSAKAALDAEIKIVSEVLEKMRKEFAELH